ncbi:YGL194C-A [Saccharomyces arboricola H-6]|uniref:YGL194C-A n=1 Tax=Saccharomyces arboricola (strain H-6 / AS 2.3317 / CBS 10644) TaxID=1160507 RepID=J8PNU0_SACAR|nr:YGL194C-A [Saccharomyces arboricola H-6]
MSRDETLLIKPFKITALTLLTVLILNLSYKLFLKRYLRLMAIWCLGITNADRNDIMWWQSSPFLERWIWQLLDDYESKYE